MPREAIVKEQPEQKQQEKTWVKEIAIMQDRTVVDVLRNTKTDETLQVQHDVDCWCYILNKLDETL